MKRAIDLTASLLGLITLLPLLALVALAVRLDSRGPAIFWSKRFGRNEQLFAMPKFRTMQIDAPQLATHLLTDGRAHLTRLGPFLRISSLDELPQLWSVLMGDMSLVGPRPALFNQRDLMELRRSAGICDLRPGITGWAQVNGRDQLDLRAKVAYELEYFQRRSLAFDLRIFALTLVRVLGGRGIVH